MCPVFSQTTGGSPTYVTSLTTRCPFHFWWHYLKSVHVVKVCSGDVVTLQKIRSLLSNDKLRPVDMARLVMLYALRYEKHSNNDISGLLGVLQRKGVNERLIKVNSSVLQNFTFYKSMTNRLTLSIVSLIWYCASKSLFEHCGIIIVKAQTLTSSFTIYPPSSPLQVYHLLALMVVYKLLIKSKYRIKNHGFGFHKPKSNLFRFLRWLSFLNLFITIKSNNIIKKCLNADNSGSTGVRWSDGRW